LIDSEKIIANVQARDTTRNIDVEGIHIAFAVLTADGAGEES
jgi:hypothetical protein